MIDYKQIERDHQRRVGNILHGSMDPRERQLSIDALIRFRDTHIAVSERLEREGAEREQRSVSKQTQTERFAQPQRRQETDSFLTSSLIACAGATIGFLPIVIGIIVAFVS